MKKLLISLPLFLLISGCMKDYNEVINPSINELNVEQVYKQDSLDYGLGDSVIFMQAKVTPANLVTDINAELNDPFGSRVISLTLLDNGNINNADTTEGDGVYGNLFIINSEYPNGQYSLSYYVNGAKYAVQYINFENGREKFAPVISDLIFPDTVQFNEIFVFSVLAIDSNGAEDISRVYYELYRPDGSQVANSQGITKFPMFDDGNPQAGDVTAGDSIYTQKLYFPPNLPSFPAGRYRFEITAEDRTSRVSNKIIHYLEVL